MKRRLVLCGGLSASDDDGSPDAYTIARLTGWGRSANVHIRLEDVAKVFLKQFSDRLVDLVEIAAYVFAADCSVKRDRSWADGSSPEPWSREFRYVIPVRDLPFWSDPDVKDMMSTMLAFMSDDVHDFRFAQARAPQSAQPYLEFSESADWPFLGVDRVLMFSGGLDSLAGAVETALSGQPMVLVSHRAAPTVSSRQLQLFRELKALVPSAKMLHVPVWINKEKSLGREHTQRTRSFLFAAIGAVIAHAVSAKGIRFFENGVVSLNLPVADEVLRARASRTTHPLVLDQLSRFLSRVFDREFIVDNPFLFLTKTEVVGQIDKHGAGALIQHTCSCAHTGFFQSKTQWHCGTCSQCIDRRIAVIAAGVANLDPDYDYVTDVFRGLRKEGYEKNMAVGYARHAIELDRMSEEEIQTKFSLELTRAVKCFSNERSKVARKFVQMHKRHGATVQKVLADQIGSNVSDLISGTLPKTSMLMCVAGQMHLTSTWTRYAQRIGDLLSQGIPISCASEKPKNELRLQELCDGILTAHDSDLVREYPYNRWASSLTKPDWSSEQGQGDLWVELKYVRVKRDVRTITEDIAADITKYGDNNRKTLFAVYDPAHHIQDEKEFEVDISKHPGNMVRIIR